MERKIKFMLLSLLSKHLILCVGFFHRPRDQRTNWPFFTGHPRRRGFSGNLAPSPRIHRPDRSVHSREWSLRFVSRFSLTPATSRSSSDLYDYVYELVDALFFRLRAVSPSMWTVFEASYKAFKDGEGVALMDGMFLRPFVVRPPIADGGSHRNVVGA